MNFNTHLQLEPSATVAINTLAMEKKMRGELIYNLSAGEPMVHTADIVIDAAIQAMKDGKTHYPPVPGIPELREQAVSWLNTTYHTHYAMRECIVTPGGKLGIYLLLQALVQPGDKVGIIAPYWVSYPSIVKIFGGEPIILETEETRNPEKPGGIGASWKLQIRELEKAIEQNIKVLILNNASNPTGVLYTKSEIEEILHIAREHNVLVISDEVYSGLVYDGEFVSCGSFEEHKNNVVVIQSCSKHFAMTGWRVGFVFGPEEIMKILTTLLGQTTSGVATVSQYAALCALENASTIMLEVKETMQKRRNVFMDTYNTLFNTSFSYPVSALYCFLPISSLGIKNTDSKQVCMELLDKAGVATVPGIAFGKEGYIRYAFGEHEEELKGGLYKLKMYLDKKNLS